MKKPVYKMYILILFCTLIILRFFIELQAVRKFVAATEVTLKYTITRIEPKCLYLTDYLYFVIPECHQTRVGETYLLIGTVDGVSDRGIFAKKRLMIGEKLLMTTDICSLNAWEVCLYEWRSTIWEALRQPVVQNLPAPHGAILLSMIYGVQESGGAEAKELFRATGTSHLQAVSGYNFALIATGVMAVVTNYLHRKTQGIVILCCILLFFFIVGVQPSIIRALLTLIAVLGTKFFLMRQYNSQFYLVLVLIFMLLFKPIWLTSVGFQLSATAVAGILYLQPILLHQFDFLSSQYTQQRGSTSPKSVLVWELLNSFTTSLAAALATAPILLYYFHELPLLSIGISTLLSSLVNLIVTVGFWTTLTAAITYSWAIQSFWETWIKVLLYIPLEVFLSSMQAASQITWLTIQIDSFPWWSVCLWYLVLLVWVKRGRHRVVRHPERICV